MSMSAAVGVPQKVAIVGCGLIGASWAALCQFHGYNVTAWDSSGDVRNAFTDSVAKSLNQLHSLATTGDASSLGRLEVVPSLEEAVADADLVQESIPENVVLKRGLYTQITKVAPATSIIASSTSSFTWSELGAELPNPTRLITSHPFNPPHLMPLVELFAQTSGVREYAKRFYESLGREVVILRKDVVGHIANRLSSALWREAVNIVAEGIADVTEVDRAMVNGPGLRWSVVGSHMAYHLGGGSGGLRHYLDHLGPSQERRWASLGSPHLTAELCDQLVAGIEEESGGHSVAELEAKRDIVLMAILKARTLEND